MKFSNIKKLKSTNLISHQPWHCTWWYFIKFHWFKGLKLTNWLFWRKNEVSPCFVYKNNFMTIWWDLSWIWKYFLWQLFSSAKTWQTYAIVWSSEQHSLFRDQISKSWIIISKCNIVKSKDSMSLSNTTLLCLSQIMLVLNIQ